ncbi:MAG: GNAT family N-acetyltransferase [Pyrinomonadaceae bacterium]|nr:GNAT family N-acetyltransferase [Pyrinomonadaceae bacterium]
MTKGNKTLNIQYKFLAGLDWMTIFLANKEAFSDYLVPMMLTPGNFENHLAQTAVDLDLSVGAFLDGRLIGYTLNGFDTWNGKFTAYDAGTGVVPDYRKEGIGTKMFEFLLPKLEKMGVQQMLLEVLSNNEKAIPLYRNLGFRQTRELEFFEQEADIVEPLQSEVQIAEIIEPKWDQLKALWDRDTSWQFSCRSLERKLIDSSVIGATTDGKCIGYGVFFPTGGVVAQLAVDKNFRRKGIASKLLSEMRKRTVEDKKLKFSNIDSRLENLKAFARSLGFKRTISQMEMVLEF